MKKLQQFEYGFGMSEFGGYLLVMTRGKIASLYFFTSEVSRDEILAEMMTRWQASFVYSPKKIDAIQLFEEGKSFEFFLSGTDFQRKVWAELRKVKRGEVVSYEEIAQRIGKPKAVRAVGTAIGRNEIAFLIPCHRVVRKSGGLGGFRWGLEVKKKMLEWEKIA